MRSHVHRPSVSVIRSRPPQRSNQPMTSTPSATMPCLGVPARPRGGTLWLNRGSYRPDVSPAHNKSVVVEAILAELDAGRTPDRAILRDAVRELLSALARKAPGRSVEVRVPPYGAVQVGDGPRHTRGTPPNVVEMDPVTWVRLATGRTTWDEAVTEGLISASGTRADISDYIPM